MKISFDGYIIFLENISSGTLRKCNYYYKTLNINTLLNDLILIFITYQFIMKYLYCLCNNTMCFNVNF